MSVSIAGRLISMPTMLSTLGRQCLAFIDGGTQWLAWAIQSPGVRYDFPDESSLLDEVQQGLHGSRLALLPQLELRVSLVKLMTLGSADLGTLAQAEAGDTGPAVTAQLQRICRDNALYTANDLAAGRTLLTQLKVDAAAVFQWLDLEDSLALRQLASEAPLVNVTPALQQEAAAFAIEQARTPLEFCDYYRFYLACTATIAAADERAHTAASALQTLLPLLFTTLDCPQVQEIPSPSEVERGVAEWLARGRQIGFARLSLAAQQIVQHTRYRGDGGEQAASNAIRLYLQSAQAFLGAHRPDRGMLGQAGNSSVFAVQNDTLAALLQVNRGVISLCDFHPVSAPLPASAPDDTRSAPRPADIAPRAAPARQPHTDAVAPGDSASTAGKIRVPDGPLFTPPAQTDATTAAPYIPAQSPASSQVWTTIEAAQALVEQAMAASNLAVQAAMQAAAAAQQQAAQAMEEAMSRARFGFESSPGES
ncbi:hypothetical protein LL965_02310 [Xanthomonas cassavae CFBP 4642]|uniref:Uncharacterized protein n=1 Tax=Xanthomonas cassavae CFBP 4642 TaxID=1219375 RepID=A0ABS8H9X8_9XANT|nr:hypothetical protein [Xanthomonas cassavae]MCC4618965.1 hypothetical protein [Xanthomonas cassavae CFBP 4642]